jgi:hypothetical protein
MEEKLKKSEKVLFFLFFSDKFPKQIIMVMRGGIMNFIALIGIVNN